MGLPPGGRLPEFVAIGHVTIDITPTHDHPEGQRRYGGAAAYAALTAAAMGLNAAVLTSAQSDYPFTEIMPGIDVINVESPSNTTFQNLYESGERRQLLGARAGDISRSDLPDQWEAPAIVVICPLTRELPANAHSWFPESSVGLVLQGFFRRWDDYGVVTLEPGGPPPGESGIALAIASHDELDAVGVRAWGDVADIVARTDGAKGAEIYAAGGTTRVAAPSVDEVDPTGAGDVWAAAYLIRLGETGDAKIAARFASAAASLSVTGVGLSGIPSRREVEEMVALDW